MASTEGTSASEFKLQAKRLREHMARAGQQLTHSQALEAVAATHGFKDWNVASAKSKEASKTYILCCSFENKEVAEEIGYFQYIMRRESLDGLVEDFKEQITTILKNDVNETWITKLYLDDIIEIESSGKSGVPVNLIIPSEKSGSLRCTLPFEEDRKGVASYQYRADGSTEDEDGSETVEPILTFNYSGV